MISGRKQMTKDVIIGLGVVIVISVTIFLLAEYLSVAGRLIRVANICAPNAQCADIYNVIDDGGDVIGRWLHRNDKNIVTSRLYGFWGFLPPTGIVVGGHDCAANDCTVRIFYDQSDSGNDLTTRLNHAPKLVHVIGFWALHQGMR